MIYLVRHGQTDWNLKNKIQGHLDIPLNKTGRKEALVCRKKLSGIKIDKIISSDLLRAKETALIINKIFSLPLTFDSRLRELNMGDLQGLCANNIQKEFWNLLNYEPLKIHAESLLDFYNRTKSFFDELDVSQNVLIVTHGGTIRMVKYLACNLHGFNQKEFEKSILQFKIQNTEVFEWNKSKLFHSLLSSER